MIPIRIAIVVLIMTAFSIDIYAASFDWRKRNRVPRFLFARTLSCHRWTMIWQRFIQKPSLWRHLLPSSRLKESENGKKGKLPASINSVYLLGTPNEVINC